MYGIKKLMDQIEVANKALALKLRTRCPAGTPISWDHGGYTQHGKVVWVSSNGHYHRLCVVNNKTEKEVRIYLWNIESLGAA